MSYRNAVTFLGTKTRVLELCNQFGGRVAVCPDWNGRVMTSTCDGLDGNSFGLINVQAINDENFDPSFTFFGGEDQFTLSPEGGPFSIYYSVDPGQQAFSPQDHIRIPVGFHEGVFSVDSVPPDPEVRMRRSIRMTNIAGAKFDLDVVRTVRLLEFDDIGAAFGNAAVLSLEQADVSFVGFETINTLVNRGPAHTKSSGLVSIRIRSMFNSGQNTIAVVPFRGGDLDDWGPSVCADFFGSAPHGRLRVLPRAALLRADSKYRCQIGVSRMRACPHLGSIDFREGVLTLVRYDLPECPWTCDYLSNEYCETVSNTVSDFVRAREHYVDALSSGNVETLQKSDSPNEEPSPENDDAEEVRDVDWFPGGKNAPYAGEVVRAYNHGPTYPGEVLNSRFYEFNVFSPARELTKGGTLTHRQYTVHINADNRTLAYIAEKILGIDYEHVYEKMLK